MTALCTDWITESDVAACDCPTAPAAQLATAITTASEVMYAATGRQWPGLCSETVRPCSSSSGGPPWTPRLVDGAWYNSGGCSCHEAGECGCGPTPQVTLPRSNVTAITEVLIDGAVLSSGAYRLDLGRWLVRVDGDGWPCCQNLTLATTQPGTWSVEYDFGDPVPTSMKRAAAVLATELVKGCINDSTCRLPQRLQTISRQGVSMAFLDPQTFLADGLTGLYEVDLIIRSVNPHGLARRSTVWSPDIAGRARLSG